MVIFNLVKNLDPAKYRVTICSTYKPDTVMVRELRGVGIQVIDLQMEGFFDVRAIPRLARILREERVDILHTHCFRADLYGRMLGRMLHVPVVVSTIHNMHVTMFRNDYNDFVATAATWLNRFSAQFAHGLVAVSKQIRRHIIEEEEINHPYIPVIYNGIEVAPFVKYGNTEREKARSQLGLNSGCYVVGTVCALYPRKGISFLIEAASHVLSQQPNSVFLIAGDGPLRKALEEQIVRAGLEGKVFLMGHRSDIPQLMSVFDVFVLPSLTEGVPIAILEAMASAKPVVATRVGGIPEIVRDGITGMLVPLKSPEALATAIGNLIREPELAAHMGAAGQARILQEFSAATMAAKYNDVYEKLLCETSSQDDLLGPTPHQ